MRNISTIQFIHLKVAQILEEEQDLESESLLPFDEEALEQVSQQQAEQLLVDDETEIPPYLQEPIMEPLEDSILPVDEEALIEDATPKEGITPEMDDEAPDFGENTESALHWAEMNNKVMRIYYRTKKGIHIERIIEPHGQFIARSTGNLIVVTYDRSIKGIRAFIVQQIEDYLFPGREFKKKMRIVS